MKLFHETVENLRIALESVRTNKLRSALATLGIIIGVFTATLMAAAVTGLSKSLQNSISAIGSDVVYIQRFAWGPSEEWWKVRSRRPVTLTEARRLQERATVAEDVAFEDSTVPGHRPVRQATRLSTPWLHRQTRTPTGAHLRDSPLSASESLPVPLTSCRSQSDFGPRP